MGKNGILDGSRKVPYGFLIVPIMSTRVLKGSPYPNGRGSLNRTRNVSFSAESFQNQFYFCAKPAQNMTPSPKHFNPCCFFVFSNKNQTTAVPSKCHAYSRRFRSVIITSRHEVSIDTEQGHPHFYTIFLESVLGTTYFEVYIYEEGVWAGGGNPPHMYMERK